jgi:hypothetical protein
MNGEPKPSESPSDIVTLESSTPLEDGSWFPWSFYVIDVRRLLGILRLSQTVLPTATRALASVSMNSSGLEVHHDATSFLKKARGLTSSQRRNACVLCSAGVRNCNGRALRVVKDDKGVGTSFRDDPNGWIRNGLFCLDDDVLPLVSNQVIGGRFMQCSMLEFELDPVVSQNQVKLVPWVYSGNGSHQKAIDKWRAGFWLRDIREGYELIRSEVNQRWLRMCPGASVPDPVFRFLVTPNARLRSEAELFMRRIDGADAAVSSSSQDGRPSAFRWGPWRGSLAELKGKLMGNKRRSINRRIWSEQNPQGSIWKHPRFKPKDRDAEFWFSVEADFLKACDAKK